MFIVFWLQKYKKNAYTQVKQAIIHKKIDIYLRRNEYRLYYAKGATWKLVNQV